MLSQIVIEEIASKPDPRSVAAAFGARRGAALLESSLPDNDYSRWSLYGADPVTTVSVLPGEDACPFEALAAGLAGYPQTDAPSSKLPFGCGWIGYISYEAGLVTESVEPIPDAGARLPLARFSLYDTVAVHDIAANRWYAVAIDWRSGVQKDRAPVRERLQMIREILREAETTTFDSSPAPRCYLTPSYSRDEYVRRVEKILSLIAAGDVYQVNLTQRFRTRTTLTPHALYQRLKEISPSSHGAFLSCDDFALISSSPELFLRTEGRKIITRPVKGTRPRSDDPALDAKFCAELQSAEKDIAELAMIVDLMRNDLGRLCDYGSVRVTDPVKIEPHPTVYHRVATVEGHLHRATRLAQILRSTCPGGSITGAPKIRAMEIISKLETTPRGAYCGAIGWIGLDGALSLNVAIRTMLQRGETVDIHAGGGIVADSDPNDEYDEMMTKLSGMARALGCELPATETQGALAEAGS